MTGDERISAYETGQWVIIDGKPALISGVSSTFLDASRKNPMWKRVLIVLMRVLGWIILIPAVIGLLISGVFTLIASIAWDPANFVIWSVISAVFGGLSALGVAMTGVVKGDDV